MAVTRKRTYLVNVTSADIGALLELGALFSATKNRWYVPGGADITLFKRWNPGRQFYSDADGTLVERLPYVEPNDAGWCRRATNQHGAQAAARHTIRNAAHMPLPAPVLDRKQRALSRLFEDVR
ncbi:hypothetical protein [Caballeronia sp. LjRoot31]|uniref:hypothetical protein n=1 Tax=Caballeronia sp. LjRoot31 TaxID=3342324 RepID=UPI003ECD0206